MGSNLQPFDVIVDTGSNKLILMDKSCTNCQAAKFDSRMSTSYQSSRVADSIDYEDGSGVSGLKVHDSISLDSSNTISAYGFNFLLVNK